MKGLLQEDQYSHKQATRGHAKKLNSTQDKADQAQLKLSLSQKHHMGVWLKLLQENLKVKEKFKIKKKKVNSDNFRVLYVLCMCSTVCPCSSTVYAGVLSARELASSTPRGPSTSCSLFWNWKHVPHPSSNSDPHACSTGTNTVPNKLSPQLQFHNIFRRS